LAFHRALQNLQGDNKETMGESLSETVRLAMACFFECIFPKNTPINDAYYIVNGTFKIEIEEGYQKGDQFFY